MRIYSQAIIYSFGDKAAQAGAWISRRSPKLKRERQQLVAGTNEASAEFVRSSFPLPSLTERQIIMNRRGKKRGTLPWQIYLPKVVSSFQEGVAAILRQQDAACFFLYKIRFT